MTVSGGGRFSVTSVRDIHPRRDVVTWRYILMLNSTLNGIGPIFLQDAAAQIVAQSGTCVVDVPVLNMNGGLRAMSGATLDVGNNLHQLGGNVWVETLATLKGNIDVVGGVLFGPGTIAGNLTNRATVEPSILMPGSSETMSVTAIIRNPQQAVC